VQPGPRLAAKRAKTKKEKQSHDSCLRCGWPGSPPVLCPLVIDAPYSMITITYVRAKRNAGEKGALPIGELEWLARASARIALIITLDNGYSTVYCL
jgi:hypothetical protein